MEKIKKIQKILTDLVENYAKIPLSVQNGLQNHAIVDLKNNHFQVVTIGWDNDNFVFSPVLHFDIIDNKIWIQQNWTDMTFEEELFDKGIDKRDVILGFIPPYARTHSDFVMV